MSREPRLAVLTTATNRIDVYQGRRHLSAFVLANDHTWADVTPEMVEQARTAPPPPPKTA